MSEALYRINVMKPDHATSLACNTILLSVSKNKEWMKMHERKLFKYCFKHTRKLTWMTIFYANNGELRLSRMNNARDEREFFIHWYRWQYCGERELDMDISEIINSDYITPLDVNKIFSCMQHREMLSSSKHSTKCSNWHIYWHVMKTWEFLLDACHFLYATIYPFCEKIKKLCVRWISRKFDYPIHNSGHPTTSKQHVYDKVCMRWVKKERRNSIWRSRIKKHRRIFD